MRAAEINQPSGFSVVNDIVSLPRSPMLRCFLGILLFTTFTGAVIAQDPVKWKLEPPADGQPASSVRLTATIEPPWHLYSIDQIKGGPIPTTISMPEGSRF